MTPLEDKLRAAIRATADEIPADPPPLRLPSQRPHRRPVWITWAAPLTAAALVVAVVALSLALTKDAPGRQATAPQAGLSAGPPAYYVALISGSKQPEEYAAEDAMAVVRATATGKVIATVVPPKPYVAFTGVTAAADDRTFVLSAQQRDYSPQREVQLQHQYPGYGEYFSPQRFFILHIDPASSTRSARTTLRALPTKFVPVGDEIKSMALSPDGTSLAATVGELVATTQLYVFNLASGTERAWSFKTCSGCFASAGGLGFGGLNVDALSWGADSRHLAFVGPGRTSTGLSAVRLLDTSAPGTSLIADSTLVAGWPGANTDAAAGTSWRGAIITPDEQAVVAVLELATNNSVGQRLVKISAVTGKVTATLNDLPVAGNYEQVLWSNATGSVLIVDFARSGTGAGILRGGKYTPIPWPNQTTTAAW